MEVKFKIVVSYTKVVYLPKLTEHFCFQSTFVKN